MKKIILYIIPFILLLSLVSGIPAGGEHTIITLERCDSVRVTVAANNTITPSEYEIKDCTETTNNSWYCECSDGYDLILITKPNTINQYTFGITYNYSVEREKEDGDSGSNGGGGSGSYLQIDYNDSIQFDVEDYMMVKFIDNIHKVVNNGEYNGVYNVSIYSDPVNIELELNNTKSFELDNETYTMRIVNSSFKYDTLDSVTLNIKHINNDNKGNENIIIDDYNGVKEGAEDNKNNVGNDGNNNKDEQTVTNTDNIIDNTTINTNITTNYTTTGLQDDSDTGVGIISVILVVFLIIMITMIITIYKRDYNKQE